MFSFNFRLKSVLANIKMEKAILELYEELDKEKSKNPMMDLSQRRSVKIKKFTETIGKYDTPMLREIASLKAKLVEVTEEHKISMTLNAKTVNSLVKMHEKTQEALNDKTNELAKIKQELQSVNVANLELLQENQELKMNNFANSVVSSKYEKNSSSVQELKTEVKTESRMPLYMDRSMVEVKEEPLNDLYIVHDNSNQNAKLPKGEENLKLKEESYFDEVHEEMGIDFVTSKTFDNQYLKTTKSQDREKSQQSSDNSNSQDISAGETSKTNQHPETLEELLERQWEQGSQFLREGGRHFDSKFYHLTYHFLDNNTYIDYNKRALRSFGLTNF